MLHAYLFSTLIICAFAEFGLVALAISWWGNVTPTHWELIIWLGVLTGIIGLASGVTK